MSGLADPTSASVPEPPTEMTIETGDGDLGDGLIPPEVLIDEKGGTLHRLDSLSILLYTLLLTLTVLTIWLFKYRRIRYLHETGLAVIYGLIIGIIIRYGMTSVGSDVTSLNVRPARNVRNVTGQLPPDVLLLKVRGRRNKEQLNRTLSYTFKGEVTGHKQITEIDQKATFDPEIFLNVILPPIIFNAGYSMKKRFFFRNIGSILAFAFVGTVISTFVVASVMYGVVLLFPHLTQIFKLGFLDTLHFGATISATDPVTVLAIFNDLNVDVNLYALVFGESVLNDAVAIVLTRTLEDYEETVKIDDGSMPLHMVLLKSTLDFIFIFSASFFVGCLMACATALLTKFTHIKQFPELESTLLILMSYSTFLLAESLNLTGIVAVLFCGICQAHYTYNNLSTESRSMTKQFFGLLNFMAENFIFSYIGVSMFTFPQHKFDAAFISGSFLAIILGRALNVYPLAFLLNLGRSKKTKITASLQHMMFLSGLRGAIAFALSIRNTLSESRQMILTTTLLIVIVTVIFCGGSTMSLLTWLGIPLGVNEEESAPLASPTHHYNSVAGDAGGSQTGAGGSGSGSRGASAPTTPESSGAGAPAIGGQAQNIPGKSLMARIWSSFDTKYMKPLLTHSNPTLMETLPECCLPIGRMLTSNEQLANHPAMRLSPEERSNVQDVRVDADDAANASSADAGGVGAAASLTQNDALKQRGDATRKFPSHI